MKKSDASEARPTTARTPRVRRLDTSDIGKQVDVYSNLTRHTWSVRYKGIVIAHVDTLRLDNVVFAISEAGRQRVIREGRKNVHAVASGTLSAYGAFLEDTIGGTPITYNPYKYQSFVTVLGKVPVYGCDVAYMEHRLVAIAGNILFHKEYNHDSTRNV